MVIKIYQNYKMDNFLILNTNLNKKKQKIIESITKYDEEKKNLKIENQNIKKEEINEHNKDEENEKEIKNEKQNIKKNNKIKEEKYKHMIDSKISEINMLKEILKKEIYIKNEEDNKNEIKIVTPISKINNITKDKNQIKFKKVEVKKVKKERNIIEIHDEENGKNKSILPNDMTKRMNSFMDFSIVLNDNSKIKDNGNKNISKL